MSARLRASVRVLKAQTLGLIRCLDVKEDPDLVPVVDALEDVYTRIVELNATIRALDDQHAFMEGVAAGVGLGTES